MKGTLFLIPVTLGNDNPTEVIPDGVINIITRLRYFIVEDVRTARRYLRKIDPAFPINDSSFMVLDKHTKEGDLDGMLNSSMNGNDIGLMSEAGLPGLADPGAEIIKLAHNKNIPVKPLSGPSSIVLGLISAGMNGQQFTFNGYLPVKPDERRIRIREIEALSVQGGTQIFMETPYRNMKLFNDLINYCKPTTRLCIAAGITTNREYIRSQTISEWRKNIPEIDKIPAVFILQA